MALLHNPNQFTINVCEQEGELSSTFDDGVMLSGASESQNLCDGYDQNERTNYPDWQFNVVVKFNVNPSSVITFREDSSGRLLVAGTPNGLQLLKDLPILSIDEKDVSTFDSLLLNGALEVQRFPVVLKFGAQPVEEHQLSGSDDVASNFQSSDDHVTFLGETSTIRFDQHDRETKEDYVQCLEILPEEQSDFMESLQVGNSVERQHYQPISYDGTQGDQSGWTKECKERAQIITELLETEKSYIKGLEVLNNQFLKPYLKPLKKVVSLDIGSFQTNVETLISMHNELFGQFCTAKNICMVFQKDIKILMIYKPYIEVYSETFRKLRKASTKRGFNGIFKKGKGMVSSNPVGWFQARGITIVQRPPRYELLLKELLDNTPIGHPMYRDLVEGLKVTKSICGDINEYQRELENEAKLVELSEGIDSKSLREHGINHLVDPARRIIRLGKVALKKTRSPYIKRLSTSSEGSFELGTVLMCNDILIIMYGKRNYVRRVFVLDEIEVKLNKEPIKPLNKKQKFDVLIEVMLSKRSEEEIQRLHSSRRKERDSVQQCGRSATGSKLHLSLTSLESIKREDYFSIFFSSIQEAEDWEKAIDTYTNIVYLN